MSRVRETLQQEAGRQLDQSAGVHNRGGKPTSVEITVVRKPSMNNAKMMRKGNMRGR